MGISLFIRKGTTKANANLSCRAIYSVQGRQVVNLTVATKISVSRTAWEQAHESKKALKEWLSTDAGKRINDMESQIKAQVDNYVLQMDGRDTAHIKHLISEIITPSHGDLPKTFVSFLERVIAQMESGQIRISKGKNMGQHMSKGVITTYKNLLATIKNYESAKSVVLGWGDITLGFVADFRRYMTDAGYKYNTSSIWDANLRRIIQRAAKLKLVSFDFTAEECKNIGRHETETIALTQAQVDALYKGDFGKLNVARDIFLLGCETAQRWSDYSQLGTKDIVRLSDGLEYFKVEQQKTRKTIYAPVTARARAILEKYDGTLPQRCNSGLNHNLKKICRMCGGSFLEVVDQHTASGTKIKVPTWQLVGTHTARRTGATLMYRAGVPLSAIMAITGHSTEKVLQAYLRLTDEQRAMDAAKNDYFKRKLFII